MSFIKEIYNKYFNIFLSLFLVLLSGILTLQAQDIHFSQFYANPLLISPSNTGNFDGDYRISYNQKSQWSVISPYNTFALSYDQSLYYAKNKFSVGGIFINDRTIQGRFNTTKMYATGAWHKIHNWHYFHVGIQAGMVINSLSNDIVYASQYVDILGDYDGSVNAGEQLVPNPNYFDVNIGLGWHKKYNNIEPQLTISLFHVNRPSNSFTGGNSRLPTRQVVHFSSHLYLLNKIYFTPGLLYMATSGATDMYLGSNFTFVLSDDLMEKSIFCGVYFKNEFENFDALVITSGINYNEWQLGLSYDINMSGLKIATNGRGGFEISLIYKALSTRTKNYTLPCDRF